MAHPVRPDSYVEINNFYTVTIYEKGSEVVRMMQTLVASPADLQGRDGFAKGMKLYFERHDGQAVTCDDFAQAIADANPGSALAQNLDTFKRWYSQAGTPRLQARGVYNAAERSYTLTLVQSCPATPGQDSKQPFVIPVTLGLLSRDGQALPLQLAGSAETLPQQTLVLTEASASYTFVNLGSEPVPSLLRGFSAPVVLDDGLSTADGEHLLDPAGAGGKQDLVAGGGRGAEHHFTATGDSRRNSQHHHGGGERCAAPRHIEADPADGLGAQLAHHPGLGLHSHHRLHLGSVEGADVGNRRFDGAFDLVI
jgi:aminopeptidase N